MSFSTTQNSDEDQPIAIRTDSQGNQEIVYLNELSEEEELAWRNLLDTVPAHELQAVQEPYTYEIYPTEVTERVLIAGKSGLGKSTITATYARNYHHLYPDRTIFMFSRVDDDPAYDDIELTRIPLDTDLLDIEIDLETLENSLVIFDDADNIQNQAVSEYIYRLVGDIVTNGRKSGIHTIFCVHQLFNYRKTRNLLHEANRLVFFNIGTAKYNIKYLTEFVGLDMSEAKRITNIRTRWVVISANHPSYFMTRNALETI